VALTSYGKRIANTDNTLKVPAAELVNLGARYNWEMGRTPVTLRAQIVNLFDEYIWEVRASDTFFYNTPRHFALRLTADL
jgi:iron complex outermembrane recepter protein